jgi:hypothetical protein
MNRSEWPGVPLMHAAAEARNVITSTTGRVANACKTLDDSPELRARVRALAVQQVVDGVRPVRRDAVIHGIRVTLTTNSPHIARMFETNWFSPERWEAITLRRPVHGPVVRVCALIDVPGVEPSAYYSRAENTMWFFNLSFYGQVKSWILGAVGRVLGDAGRAHSVHGACVEVGGRGLLLIAPTGTGKSTSTFGLLRTPGSRFHSDDWVYVRYAGAGRELAARAYISERNVYVRTNLVDSYPEAARAFLAADVENVPPPTPELLAAHEGAAAAMDAALAERGILRGRPRLWEDLARLAAFEDARAMVAASDLFAGAGAIGDPEEGLPIAAVVLLERDERSATVLERLDEVAFVSTLLIGRTPRGGFDTAYNAYRLVEDAAERALVERHADDPASLCRAAASRKAPATLRGEAAQLRRLWRAAPAYRLNAILARNGRAPLEQALEETVELLSAVALGEAPRELRLADLPGAPSAAV